MVGKVSEDRFNGGLCITAEKVFDIAAARIQYGFKLEMDVGTDLNPTRLAEVLQPYRQQDGLPVRLRIKQQLELTLGAKVVAVEY